MKKLDIISSTSEIGAGTRGASMGPEAIELKALEEELLLFHNNPVKKIVESARKPHHFTQASGEHLDEFIPLYEQLAAGMQESLQRAERTLVISADHSNAAGWFSGFREEFPDKKLGLLWIDAHGDIHTPYTSPSGNVHGMPIGALLGLDNKDKKVRDLSELQMSAWHKMKHAGAQGINPKITPEDILFIDIRDLEKEEWKSIEEQQIAHFTPKDRKEKGIDSIIEAAKSFFRNHDLLYVSFDVDSLDSKLVQGTGTPVENGLELTDAKKLLKAVWELPQTRVLEFTEINPLLDDKNKVAGHVVELLKHLNL